MPEAVIAPDELQRPLAGFDDTPLSAAQRGAALERFRATPSGSERPGRYWKVDLDALAPDPGSIAPESGSVSFDGAQPRVIACDLRTAAAVHPALLARAFGASNARATKFGALTAAFAGLGAFVYVPADTAATEPIVVRYALADGAAQFPSTVVLLERGAHATVIERFEGGAEAFVAATTELVLDENANLTFASVQRLGQGARFVATRAALPGRDANVSWSSADLGADLAASDLTVTIAQPGADAQLALLFFTIGSQHVEARTTVDHIVGRATSQTLVKSAAAGRGQGRYTGNIRIVADAQGTVANLRDDALLLSKTSHIDSIPALEIAANDVRAYHGATVGAIDEDEIFYMQTRGIERESAERMIALGFFEPAIERFPSEELRAELRAALAGKIA